MSTLTIAFPSKGITNPAFATALRLLSIGKPFDRYEVLYVSGADVAVARNTILEHGVKGDYIFWLDDDVLPQPDALMKLASHNKDIVSGLYFARRQPYFPQIYRKNKDNEERYDAIENCFGGDLIEVDACGMGCVLVKREVFEKIKKPYFQYIPRGENTDRKGEDYYFCEKVKKEGYKIYCDTSVICQHIGEMIIGPELWQISLDKLDNIKKQLGEEGFEKYKKQVQIHQNKNIKVNN